ncbi:MAG: cytochrome b [Paracoccaceae bacterium]
MRNTSDSFGWLTRLIHWIMAGGILFMLGLGTYIDNMTVGLSNLWLFGLHKSIGILILALFILRALWHLMSPPPASLTDNTPDWQISAARWSHRMMYALMGLVPLTGWIGSGASGIPVMLFDWFALPPMAPASEAWVEVAFGAHAALTKLLFLVILLHVGGAMQRHFIKQDRTLIRMTKG